MNVKQQHLPRHAELGANRRSDERPCSDVRWGAQGYWMVVPTRVRGVTDFDNERERKEGST